MKSAIHLQREYDAFLALLGDRDRQNVERHVDFCTAERDGQHARLWKRLAGRLARLAPRAAQTVGQRAVRFYVTDGKYRQQIFALEDLRDGNLVVYTSDVLDEATRGGLLVAPVAGGEALEYTVRAEPAATVTVERLTAAKTTDAPDYYKHMLGWNRTALRITFPVDASASLVDAVEAICDLSAPAAPAAPASAP